MVRDPSIYQSLRHKRKPRNFIHLNDRKPSHTDHNIETPFLSTGVLEGPHTITVDVPESSRRGVHSTLTSVVLCALSGSGLVNHALLHDGAVHGEAVGSRGGRVGGSSSGDKSFEDSVLVAM